MEQQQTRHYQHILIIYDDKQSSQPALSQGLTLAKASQAKVTLLLPIYDFSYELTTLLSQNDRDSMKAAMVADRKHYLFQQLKTLPQAKEFVLNIEVIWHPKAHEAIIDYAQKQQCDLIIKSTFEHHGIESLLFTPTDWHLIRRSHPPLLLAKEHYWQSTPKILTAIHTTSNNEEHQQLNHRLIAEAFHHAQLLNGEVHLVNAYPAAPINIAIEFNEFNQEDYQDSIFKYHEQHFYSLAERYQVSKHQAHLQEGTPEDVIAKVAADIQAHIVVIGSVGRTGFPAALLGNTAEHVIDNLNCDILVITPHDS